MQGADRDLVKVWQKMNAPRFDNIMVNTKTVGAEATPEGIKVKKGVFPWTASGRAIANGRDEGVTKLLFDDSPEAHGHGRILGGGIVGTHAGDMIGEIALAIEMGADAVDIGKTIHPHPTLGESLGMAAEVAHGSCTDLPPQRK
jgi:dihydrolipoamide dehydrogenase